MNCLKKTVTGVPLAGKEPTNHKTLVSSLTSSRNGNIFESGKNGHFWKFCEGVNEATWSKIANFFGDEFQTEQTQIE